MLEHDRALLRLDPLDGASNRFLRGQFAPIRAEHDVRGRFPLRGSLPPELEGAFIRNGPNPAYVADPSAHRWCTGDGMVHLIELRGGQAVAYRNRWIRTRALAEQVGTHPPAGPVEPVDSPVNASVRCHAGKLLAFSETGLPVRLTRGLGTRRTEDFDGMVASPVSPLPRIDPTTGGLAMIGYDCFGPPFLRYHELDAGGSVIHSTAVNLERPSVQHDFAVTASHVVFLDLPAVYDLDLARHGMALPFRWDPDAPSRLGVLRRGAPGSEVRWFGIAPRFAFHVMNAYESGTDIVIDACRHDEAFGQRPTGPPVLERWTINPPAGRVTTTQLDDYPVEWPNVNAGRVGLPHRFGYCATPPGHAHHAHPDRGVLVRYDLHDNVRTIWDPGAGRFATEPVFVKARDGRGEDEGWVLSLVYDLADDTSSLMVLDASAFDKGPVGVVELPCRIPYGYHGIWVEPDQFAEIK